MNSFYKIVVFLFFISFFCSSCATIFNGSRQEVVIKSQPAGATVKIRGKVVGTTPLTIKESPKKPLDIVFAYQGYDERTFVLSNKYEWIWLLLDAPLTYGPVCIPFAVDMITQAPFRFVQKEVMMNFDSAYTPPVSPVVREEQAVHVTREKMVQSREEIMAEEKARRDEKVRVRMEVIKERRRQDSIRLALRQIRRDSIKTANLSLLTQYKNSITWQPTALIVSEFNFTYHRTVYKGVSVGVEAGYKQRSRSKGNYNNNDGVNINDLTTEIMLMPFSESKYAGLAVKIPLPIVKGLIYVSAVGFYRSSNYDHVTVSWENQIDKYVVERYYDSASVNLNSYGLKSLVGIRPIVKISPHVAIEFDLYCGFSVRKKEYEIYHYKESSQITTSTNAPKVVENVNRSEKGIDFVPALQAGFRVGLRF